ncbi:hypothetical protein L798_14986 [Zootermopsis nevadensis]|uniref:Uncharacterized protein n=1 Tax=Zootermopsis nevadensis TaxID=136037 RepID=A0A067RQ52_ZOONE|nr:hypothetical protein L798_14986 [Zootermopsis nevadensis]
MIAANKGHKPKKQAIKKAASFKEEGEIMSTVDDRWPFSTNQENEQQTEGSAATTEVPEEFRFKQLADGTPKSKLAEQREKRSAHHEPGHVGYDDQQHSGQNRSNHQQLDHDHTNHQESDHEDHSQHKQSTAAPLIFPSILLLLSPFITKYL